MGIGQRYCNPGELNALDTPKCAVIIGRNGWKMLHVGTWRNSEIRLFGIMRKIHKTRNKGGKVSKIPPHQWEHALGKAIGSKKPTFRDFAILSLPF